MQKLSKSWSQIDLDSVQNHHNNVGHVHGQSLWVLKSVNMDRKKRVGSWNKKMAEKISEESVLGH